MRELAQPAAPGAPVALESAYTIDTALYRMRGATELRLRPGERVAPGDGVFVKLRVSVPAYVYIVNEDDQGEGLSPVPVAGPERREPSSGRNDQPDSGNRWPRGFRLAGNERRGTRTFPDFREPRTDARPRGGVCRPPPARTRPDTAGAEAARRSDSPPPRSGRPHPQAATRDRARKLAPIFSTPLGETEETARGLWVRQLTIDNQAAGR